MRRITVAIILAACATITAAEAPLPPKADAAYRAYLAALAKTYQSETAKLEAALKREAAAAKKDPAATAAIDALQARMAKHEHLDDFAALVKGDLLDAGKIAGGADQLIGTWAETTTTFRSLQVTEITIQPKGRALIRYSTPGGSSSEQSADWAVVTRDGAQVFVLYRSTARSEADIQRGAFTVSEIPLPLPVGADIVATYKSVGLTAAGGQLRSQDPRTWTPVKPAAK